MFGSLIRESTRRGRFERLARRCKTEPVLPRYAGTVPEARVLYCPNCGGTTPEDTRNCHYCRAPVATVRCLYCFHMNIPDSVHCSGCGVELGLEPAGRSDYLKCPACEVDFEVFEGGPGKLRDCGKCGGQF